MVFGYSVVLVRPALHWEGPSTQLVSPDIWIRGLGYEWDPLQLYRDQI